MLSRDSWPRGLKILLCLAVVELVVGIGQTFYWLVITREFFPHLTIQGGYAGLALLLAAASVAFGMLGRRRAFALTFLVTAALNVGVTAFFDVEMVRTGAMDDYVPVSWNVDTWYFVWNCIVIAVNALVFCYLLRHEFKFPRPCSAQT